MKHKLQPVFFLICYHRPTGRLELTEFSDRIEAYAERRRREGSKTVDEEVVVLEAENKVALQRTHARYFKDPQQLIAS